MRRILTLVISMVALCVHSATQEETRQIVNEYVEAFVNLTWTPENKVRLEQMESVVVALGKEVWMPLCCEILAEKFDDPNPKYVNTILSVLCQIDGEDRASYGDPEILGWARRIMREENSRFARNSPEWYLMAKGDARDLDITLHDRYKKSLAMRVAGTNVISTLPGEELSPVDWYGCFPSVTNTGPQGLYVNDILGQYWKKLERAYREGDRERTNPYKDISKIPAELLTMVVWFDEDGNPVCNVDLEKYGLTMPELDVPNKPKGKEKPSPPLEGERPREPETSGGIQPPEQTPPAVGCRRHFWLYAGVAVLTLGIGYFYVWRKISKD